MGLTVRAAAPDFWIFQLAARSVSVLGLNFTLLACVTLRTTRATSLPIDRNASFHLPIHKLLDAMAAMTIATSAPPRGRAPPATLSAARSPPVTPVRLAARSRSAPRSRRLHRRDPDDLQRDRQGRENFDLAAWGSEVRQVEKELKAEIGEDDVDHLNKILTCQHTYYGGLAVLFATPFLTNIFSFIGGANPIAAFMMSTAICAGGPWSVHHVCHGGYNTAVRERRRDRQVPPPHLRQGPARRIPTGWTG